MLVWIQNPFDNLPSEGFRKQRYWLMAEAFVRAGHEVVYWTSSFSHAKKGMRDEGSGIRDQGSGIRDRGIEVRMIPTPPYLKNVSLTRVLSHRAYARDWLRLAREPVPSSLFPVPSLIISSCPTLSAAESAIELGKRFSARVVIDVQDAWPETFERLAPKGLRWLARIFLWPLYRKARRIYGAADLVTGVCDAYRTLTGRADYYRAYLGIEGNREPGTGNRERGTGNRDQGVKLVYAGGLGKTYDLKTLVKAVAENGDMTLDIAGFGSAVRCPPSAARRVRFHGALSASDLQRLLAMCDIGVIPMNDESQVGLPNKLFDYAAAELAIVSSLGGESAALLKKYRCGAVYRPGDVASLTAAIRQAMTFKRGASRTLCAAEFDAAKIYDDYVAKVTR